MPRKTAATQSAPTSIQRQKQELERHAERIKQELGKTREFLDKAPALVAEAQRKQQREVIERFHRPSRIEGPADFRLELIGTRPAKPVRKLRKDRSIAPLVTLLLLAGFCAGVYYAWRVLWQG